MKVKEVTIQIGPTIQFGDLNVFLKSTVSMTLEDPTPKDLVRAREVLEQEYWKAAAIDCKIISRVTGLGSLKNLVKYVREKVGNGKEKGSTDSRKTTDK